MTERLTIWTFDWVPPGPRGYVRDLRLRWALEEAGLGYAVKTVPFDDRGPAHLAMQPFAQVPFLEDDGVPLFESGACLLHLGELSEALMPQDRRARADVLQWVVAALNSVEMVTVPWWFINLSSPPENPLADWMARRFASLEPVIAGREWMAAGRFTIADILMADVLRVPAAYGALDGFDALQAYVARVCDRPAFHKARADQIAHFEQADRTRPASD